jgi:hypothetical protein
VGGWGENKGFEDCEASVAAAAAAVVVEEKSTGYLTGLNGIK